MKKTVVLFAIIILCILLFLIFLFAFSWKEEKIFMDSNYNELLSYEMFENHNHQKVLSELISDVSIGFQNYDGSKTLYVYSSPIFYLNNNGQYEMIDTRIINVDDEGIKSNGYPYTIANSDIKTYFPKYLSGSKGIFIEKDIQIEYGFNLKKQYATYETYENFIGEEKHVISYELNDSINLYTYPTSVGSNCEFYYTDSPVNATITMWLNTSSNLDLQVEPGGYIAFWDEENSIAAVMQQPLIKTPDGNISYNTSLHVEKSNGYYKITLKLDEDYLTEGTRVFTAFEIKRGNQPDNTIYSKRPNLANANLSHFAVIGNDAKYGLGRQMVRYKFTKYFDLKAEDIIDASYYTYTLTTPTDTFEMKNILEDWCAITGNWNSNYQIGDHTVSSQQYGNIISFDITEEVKLWCLDASGELEHFGLLLKSNQEKENTSHIFLSNDNTLYRNRSVIHFK